MTNAIAVNILSDTEIEMSRTFDAPRSLVFECHSSCEHMVRWWGGRKYETECEMDFRVGGAYRFVHRAPGEEYAFRGEYREIVAPERLSYSFEFEGMPGHVCVDTLTFTESNGKTTIHTHTTFASKEDRDGMLQSGMEDGANESYDRLDELLASLK